VEHLSNATNVTSASRFIVYMVSILLSKYFPIISLISQVLWLCAVLSFANDRLALKIGTDVPSRSNPTSRNVRHFLGGNFTLSTTGSSLLSTATQLTNISAATNEHAAPAPSPNTGSHRYVYMLYDQSKAFNTEGFASLGFNSSLRTSFNIGVFSLPLVLA